MNSRAIVERVTGSPLLLGVDIGTSSTKAVLLDATGREVVAARRATPFITRGDRTEMAVGDLLRCLTGVFDELGDLRRWVTGVGFAGMAESGAPFDRSGAPLAPVIAWHDSRGEEVVRRLERDFGPDLSRRVGQKVRAVMTVAKLGWLVGNGVGDVARWLGVPELGLHALTGAERTEFSLAVRTGCYDVATRQWLPEVTASLGFSVDVFGEVAAAGAAMGRVSAEAASWSRLPAGIPVTVAGHDHLAGLAGAGVRAGQWGNSVGTAETIVARSVELPDLAAALESRIAVNLLPGGQERVGLVSAARAGIVLEAVSAALGHNPADLDRMAVGTEPLPVEDGVIDDLAQRDPTRLPNGSPGEVWAGVLHALVARTADGCERLRTLFGDAEAMVVFGGGSVSEPWHRAKTERLDVPVRRSVGATAVARGAAVHAGVAAGWWASADDAPPPPALPESPAFTTRRGGRPDRPGGGRA